MKRLRGVVIAACLAAQVAIAAPCVPTLPGANVAGGEFNGGKPQARYGYDYIYPAAREIALLRSLGLRLMRVPFLWERLQPAADAPLDAAELARLDDVVRQAEAAGLVVVLDAHNYGTFQGQSLARPGAARSVLGGLWRRLAEHYKDRPAVVFGLMNEPKDIEVDAWAAIAVTTVAAIRSTGARNVVLVPGTNWDGAHSWFAGAPGRSNADVLLPVARGDDRVVFEVHQYFDDNFSGTSDTCGGAARVTPALRAVAAWARKNRVRVMLGEFGVSRRPECLKALDDALAAIEADGDVWYGWTYWSAGAWWGEYPFNLQPPTGEAPQGRVLAARAAALDARRCTATSR